MSPRVWFMTGCSSGFGRAMTEYALSKGDNVVATLRKPADLADLQQTFPASRLVVVQLDVNDPQAILTAFAKAKEVFGRIDVVFNNAGWTSMSEVEGMPDDVGRKLFETNFWGALNVSKESVRFFREENPSGAGGRLITVSSFVGLRPVPIGGYYSATKHALEAITQALSEEIEPEWNIKITNILPGRFHTSVGQKRVDIPPHAAYTKPTNPAANIRTYQAAYDAPDSKHKIGDAKKAVRKIYEISELSSPPLRILFGNDAIELVKAQLESLKKDVDGSKVWSEDLMED